MKKISGHWVVEGVSHQDYTSRGLEEVEVDHIDHAEGALQTKVRKLLEGMIGKNARITVTNLREI